MVNLDSLFSKPFRRPKISDEKLFAYSIESIERLAANPRFSELAQATLEHHEGYFGAMSDESIHLRVQKSLTQMMTETRQEFLELVSQHEGLMKSNWGKGSVEYNHFYPYGITDYRAANLKNISEKMKAYEAALKKYESDLPAKVVAAFIGTQAGNGTAGVIPRFHAARAAQMRAIGETEVKKGAVSNNREALEDQLMTNLLTVALAAVTASEGEKIHLQRLFPDHLLKYRSSQNQGDTPAIKATAGATPESAAVAGVREPVSRSTETNRFAAAVNGSNGSNGHGTRVDIESLMELDPTRVN